MTLTPREEMIINKIKELASKLNATVDIEEYAYPKKEIRINGQYFPIDPVFTAPVIAVYITQEDEINKVLRIAREIFHLFRKLKEINPTKWERISLSIKLFEEEFPGDVEFWIKYDGKNVTIDTNYYCSSWGSSPESLLEYIGEKMYEYDFDASDVEKYSEKILEEVYEKFEKEFGLENNKELKKIINKMRKEGIIYGGWSFDERFGDNLTVELRMEKEIPLNMLNYDTLFKITEELYKYAEAILSLADDIITSEIDKKIENMAKLVH